MSSIISSVVCCVAFGTTACGLLHCPPHTFLNDARGKCVECREHCRLAKTQIIHPECQRFCQGYKIEKDDLNLLQQMENASPCPPGMYRDPTVGGCSQCSTLCDFHQTQGTTEQCREQCPQEFGKSRPPPRPPNGGLGQGHVTVIVLVTFLTIASVVGCVLICCLCPHRLPGCLHPRLAYLLGVERRPVPETLTVNIPTPRVVYRSPQQDTRPHSPGSQPYIGGYVAFRFGNAAAASGTPATGASGLDAAAVEGLPILQMRRLSVSSITDDQLFTY